MKEIYSILKQASLFDEIAEDKYACVLNCLKYQIKQYEKGQYIKGVASLTETAGVVLSGKVYLSMVNRAGQEHNIRFLEKGNVLYESINSINEDGNIHITAATKTKILFLCFSEIYTRPKIKTCPHILHISLNILKIVAKENMFLSQKLEILAQKKMRDKINTYIKNIMKEDKIIKIPFNRQELANYLCVDRSALSRELSHMKEDGILDYNKNTFIIKDMSEFL